MKKYLLLALLIPALLTNLVLAETSINDDYQKGLTAAKNDNFILAKKILQPLAINGHLGAKFNLSGVYKELGDEKEAFFWLEKAGKHGHPRAQNNLGNAYQFGEGVEKNLTKAIEWYGMAMKQGHIPSMFNLALICESKNQFNLSLEFFQMAAIESSKYNLTENQLIFFSKLKSMLSEKVNSKEKVRTIKNDLFLASASSPY